MSHRPIAGLLPPAREGLEPWGLVTAEDAGRILAGRLVLEWADGWIVEIYEMSEESLEKCSKGTYGLKTYRMPWDAKLQINFLCDYVARESMDSVGVHRGRYVPRWPLRYPLSPFHATD